MAADEEPERLRAVPDPPAEPRARPQRGRPAQPEQGDFLTVAEVAQLTRVSRMTVYRLVHSGRLPAVQIGRSFRVPRAAVDDYLRDALYDAG